MTTAEPEPRTETIPARQLQAGAVVINPDDSRMIITDLDTYGGRVYAFQTSRNRPNWRLDEPVTVLAESLPASYWLAKHDQLIDRIAAMADELELELDALAANGRRHGEMPEARSARVHEAARCARKLRGLLPH